MATGSTVVAARATLDRERDDSRRAAAATADSGSSYDGRWCRVGDVVATVGA